MRVTQAFVDESGDLGGSKSKKRYFTLAAVLCNENAIETRIRRISQTFALPELKFSDLSYDEKVGATELLSSLEFSVAYVVLSKNDGGLQVWLDKSKHNKSLEAIKLYGALVSGLRPYLPRMAIVVDRNQYSGPVSKSLVKKYSVNVIPDDSQKRAGLQLADAMANIVYLHYQHKNGELIGMIRDKIIFERLINEKSLRKL